MIHKDYCSRCKRKNIPLLRYSKSKTTQYYYCRSCMASKMKKYFKTPSGFKNITNNNRKASKDKVSARNKVAKALTRGLLVKAKYCSICGNETKTQAHHFDYSEPLAVAWLCSPCHHRLHRVKYAYE